MPFHALVDSGVLDEPVFAFYLTKDAPGSELTFGGTNKRHYKGELTYSEVIRTRSWTIKLDDVTVNGQKITKHRRATVEPLMHTICVPADEIEALAKLVGAKLVGHEYEIDCSSQGPEIVIELGGAKFPITKSEYTLRKAGSSTCHWAMNSMAVFGNTWYLGLPFFEKYYSVFNWGDGTQDSRKIGFALRV